MSQDKNIHIERKKKKVQLNQSVCSLDSTVNVPKTACLKPAQNFWKGL